MSDKRQHDPGVETGPRQATPFTRVWYWAFAVMGIVLIAGGITPWKPAMAISDLPEAYHVVLGLFILIGAMYCLIGTQVRDRIDESWALERIGCLVGTAGWAAYMVAVAFQAPQSLMDSLFPLASTVGLMVRWNTLRRREKLIRSIYDEVDYP